MGIKGFAHIIQEVLFNLIFQEHHHSLSYITPVCNYSETWYNIPLQNETVSLAKYYKAQAGSLF